MAERHRVKYAASFMRRMAFVTLILSVTACGSHGNIIVVTSNHEAAPWRYVRGGPDARGATSSGAYSGRLDILWERGLKEKPQGALTHSNGALVVAGAKRRIFLINPKNGETIAKFKNRSSPQSGGLLVDSLLYNSTAPPFNYLDCRGVANGKLRWRSVILDISAPLLTEGKRLYALGGDGVAYCFDRFSGALLWEKKLGGKMIAAPALETSAEGDILWITNSNGWIAAFDASSGKERYRREMNESLVSTPAVSASGTIYFSGQGGHAFSLTRQHDNSTAEFLSELINPAEPLECESPVDSFTFAEFSLQSPSWSSPALKGEHVIFVDNRGNVYCFNSSKLTSPLWRVALKGALVASPIVVGEYVVVGLLNGRLYVLRLETGEVVTSRQLESAIKYSPISDGEKIFVATQRKSLYCLGSLSR